MTDSSDERVFEWEDGTIHREVSIDSIRELDISGEVKAEYLSHSGKFKDVARKLGEHAYNETFNDSMSVYPDKIEYIEANSVIREIIDNYGGHIVAPSDMNALKRAYVSGVDIKGEIMVEGIKFFSVHKNTSDRRSFDAGIDPHFIEGYMMSENRVYFYLSDEGAKDMISAGEAREVTETTRVFNKLSELNLKEFEVMGMGHNLAPSTFPKTTEETGGNYLYYAVDYWHLERFVDEYGDISYERDLNAHIRAESFLYSELCDEVREFRDDIGATAIIIRRHMTYHEGLPARKYSSQLPAEFNNNDFVLQIMRSTPRVKEEGESYRYLVQDDEGWWDWSTKKQKSSYSCKVVKFTDKKVIVDRAITKGLLQRGRTNRF